MAGLGRILWLALVWPPSLAAQRRVELGPAATVVASDPWFGGLGARLAVPLSDEIRLGGLAALGQRGDRLAGRVEARVEAVLPGGERRAVNWYGGVGLAANAAQATQGFVLVVVGIEGRPTARGRWWLDAGVGGGGRVSGGWQWRLGSGPRPRR